MYNYIPHPSNMRTTDQVLAMRIAEGAAGYGIYMMLLELLRDAEGRSLVCNPAHLAFAINEQDVPLVERIVKNYGLFTLSEDNRFSSPWLEAAMDEYDAKKKAAQEAGRRGAAKRYGKQLPETAAPADQKPHNVAPYGDPIGGGMGSVDTPHANNTQHNEISLNRTSPNQSKSKLLSLSWGEFGGDYLFSLARERGTYLSTIDQEEAYLESQRMHDAGDDSHNPQFIFDYAKAFGLNHEQYEFLRLMTDNGRTGTPEIMTMVKAYNAHQSGEFRPKYGFEYTLTRLLDDGHEH